MTEESKALVAVTNNYAVREYSAQDIKELLVENVGEGGLTQFDLTQIKIPAGGSTTWTIETIEGEEETKAIEGVCVLWKETSAYWINDIDATGGGTPPDAICTDGHNFIALNPELPWYNNPGHSIPKEECPFYQWGSAKDGRGKAAKDVRHLFILREGDILPCVVNAAPMSIAPMKRFFLGLVTKGIPYYGAKVRLELEKDKNAQNITYAKIKPSMINKLTPDEIQFFKSYSNSMKPLLGQMVVPTYDAE